MDILCIYKFEKEALNLTFVIYEAGKPGLYRSLETGIRPFLFFLYFAYL